MSFSTEIHKRGFEAGFYASDFRFIDVGFCLESGAVFDI